MNKVYKYILKNGYSTISVTEGTTILSVAGDNGDTCLYLNYALPVGGSSLPTKLVDVLVVLTGADLPKDVDTWEFIGTVVFPEYGNYVVHVFTREHV